MLYEQGQSFQAITDSFLFQVFSSLVLILMVSLGFEVGSQFCISGSNAVLVVEGLVCGLIEGILVLFGWLNNL